MRCSAPGWSSSTARLGFGLGGFDLAGEPLGERTRVATAGPTTWTLNAVLTSDGRAWIVFDAVVGTTTEELFLVEVDQTAPSGPPDSIRLTEDDGFLSKYSNIDVDVGASHVALTWFDELDGNREVWCTSR